jgi:carbon monoxide dehydrogenase subunit G
MKIEHSFEVEAPIGTVWEALTDVERVSPCLPGAEINERQDDGSYKGTFTVKLGPTTASYRGTLRMEELDEASHTATMRGDGTDKRGQGGVKATVVSRMREEGGVTKVDVDTDLNITGRLARFGRGGMVQDVSTKLLDRFADCLKEELSGPAATAESAPATTEEVAPAAPGAPPEEETTGEAPTLVRPPTAAGTAADSVAAAMSQPADEAPPAPEDAASAAATAAPSDAAGESVPPRRPPAEPLDAGALAGEVLAERAKKLAPAVLALLLLLVMLRRRS